VVRSASPDGRAIGGGPASRGADVSEAPDEDDLPSPEDDVPSPDGDDESSADEDDVPSPAADFSSADEDDPDDDVSSPDGDVPSPDGDAADDVSEVPPCGGSNGALIDGCARARGKERAWVVRG
jgi:hypothetical protein